MATKIQLRKEQERVVGVLTSSLPFIAGDAVVPVKPIDNPGILYRDGVPEAEQTLMLDKGVTVRAIGEDGAPVATPSFPADGGFGVKVGAPTSSVEGYKRVVYEDTNDLKPDFPDFGNAANITKVLVTLQAQLRGGVLRTITPTGPNRWNINYSEAEPVWGEPIAPGFRPIGGRIISQYRTLQEANTNLLRIRNYFPAEPLDRVFARRWAFNPRSTITREASNIPGGGGPGGLYVDITLEENLFTLRLYGFSQDDPSTLYPQLSGYEPARVEKRTGPITLPTTPTRVGPSNVEFQVVFYKDSTELAKQSLNLANTNNTQTIAFSTTVEGANRIVINTEPEYRLNWIKYVDVNQPVRLASRNTNYYPLQVQVLEEGQEREQLFFYAQAAPIRIPSVATVSGTAPHQYLTFTSGNWDGTSYKMASTRCPIWLLLEVLTHERYGIQKPLGEIDVQSFLEASKYCNELVDGKPRWAYDGLVEGKQSDIIGNILSLVRGGSSDNPNIKYSLVVERPTEPLWLICKSAVLRGEINYRRAGEPRPPIRATYLDRLTAVERATPGPINSREQEVVWQDKDVVERWARWQNLKETRLLDTAEFSLAWDPGYRIEDGDVVAIYDEKTVGVRVAGTVLDAGAGWLILDRLPFELWPGEIGDGRLINDPWGYKAYKFPAGKKPVLVLQKADGGLVKTTVDEVQWGERDAENRVLVSNQSLKVEPFHTTWACEADGTLEPTLYRVESILERNGEREFDIIATQYIKGMHAFIDKGTPIPTPKHKFVPPSTGPELDFLGDGDWDDLNETFPLPSSIPFGDPGNFDDLTN